MRSLRQSHPAEQVGVARVGADVVEEGINLKKGHFCSPLLIAFVEPVQRLILLTEFRSATETESLTSGVPSARQKTSASSLSTRLQAGQRFIFHCLEFNL